jgi:hypothetical protein
MFAAEALAGREDPAVTSALLDSLRGDNNRSVRLAAAGALAGQEDPAVTKPCRTASAATTIGTCAWRRPGRWPGRRTRP